MAIRISSGGNMTENPQGKNPLPSPFRMFEDYFNNWAMQSALAKRSESFRPVVDIYELENKLFIRCELPGVEEKSVDLKLDGRTLTIKGERKQEPEGEGLVYHQIESSYGLFSRSFELPNSLDLERISAAFKAGVLTITIPQRPEVQPRQIKINS
jgi:HSP20 family protein